jgi:hypothetical protein
VVGDGVGGGDDASAGDGVGGSDEWILPSAIESGVGPEIAMVTTRVGSVVAPDNTGDPVGFHVLSYTIGDTVGFHVLSNGTSSGFSGTVASTSGTSISSSSSTPSSSG